MCKNTNIKNLFVKKIFFLNCVKMFDIIQIVFFWIQSCIFLNTIRAWKIRKGSESLLQETMLRVQEAEEKARLQIDEAKKQAAGIIEDAHRQAEAIQLQAKESAAATAKDSLDKVIKEEAAKAEAYDKELEARIHQQSENAMLKKEEVISSVISELFW